MVEEQNNPEQHPAEPSGYIFNVPDLAGDEKEMKITNGQLLFVLGANGSGKSGLMHKLFVENEQRRENKKTVKRITVHRQTWFNSNAVTLTAEQKVEAERAISIFYKQADARWRDHDRQTRSQIIFFDLIDAENILNKKNR